jgi:diadenosine tetraphosphate (Ap4A) HIT family hydrolase
MDCPFCHPENEQSRVLEMRNTCFVLFSNPRKVKGHLLVIPKRHVEKLGDLNGEERKELFDTIIDWQEKILQKMAGGCDIRQNTRPFLPESGVKVDHVHVHLVPREFEDEMFQKSMKFEAGLFKPLTNEEIKEVTHLLMK